MVKRKMMKKLVALGLAVAMLMGMTTNVTALTDYDDEYREFSLGDNGIVGCYIYCHYYDDWDYAKAYTITTANYEADEVYAYVALELDALIGGSYLEPIDEKSHASLVKSDYVSQAFAEIEVDLVYNTGLYAYSDHDAYIDDVSGGIAMMAED